MIGFLLFKHLGLLGGLGLAIGLIGLVFFLLWRIIVPVGFFLRWLFGPIFTVAVMAAAYWWLRPIVERWI